MVSSWPSSVRTLFAKQSRKAPKGSRRRRGHQQGVHQVEALEPRRVMAFDLVAAFAENTSTPFYIHTVSSSTVELNDAPQQITLRFGPGVKIDPATLSTGIRVTRSGGPSDPFGNANDVNIVPGSIQVDDAPNQNQVIIRFAETLPDDIYRVNVLPSLGSVDDANGDANAATFNVRLDVGAFVVGVVPQPVSRVSGALSQSRNTIDIYFNSEDPLLQASATNAAHYRLIEVDAGGNDVGIPVVPNSVSYTASTGRAVLTFAAGAIADAKTYRLEIGAAAPSATSNVNEISDSNSSFSTAQNLGAIAGGSVVLSGAVNVRPTIATPAGSLGFLTQPGTLDEPGHRQLPTVDSGEHGIPFATVDPATGIQTLFYNFRPDYGIVQGNPVQNAITETQKQRAREIFELLSLYLGVRFVETPTSGIVVVTGDMRALDPSISIAPAGLAGTFGSGPAVGQPGAIMDSTDNWGSSEYGGSWFRVAMHEILHTMGLPHSYDLPSIMGTNELLGPIEPVFPGDYDIGHARQYYPTNSTDIDLYKFTLAEAGRLTAETIVARPGSTVTSLLDTVVTLYREDGGVRTLIARNDNYIGRDSFLDLDLSAGTYYIAVTAVGNTAINPEVADSGYGGQSEGAYSLKVGFVPRATSLSTIVDLTGKSLDGDRDGQIGGAFKFWFNTASSANTVFVDKSAAAGGNGLIATPYNTIKAAIDNVGSRKIIRIVGNAANTPYLIGTDLAGNDLADGPSFKVPQGVTVMIDAGAIFKLRETNIDVGSSSELVNRAGAALQVLGTPTSRVFFTSYHDDAIVGDSDGFGPAAAGGQWGGITFREDSDAASKKAFVNTVHQATFRYGGGQVAIDGQNVSLSPIQIESTRPTIAFNRITTSAGAAISATPNAFEDSNGRVGPEIRGNNLFNNSINGLFLKIATAPGKPLETLDVAARFKSIDIVYVLQENLVISGGVGGYLFDGVNTVARASGRLHIDPGVVVKLQGARIELERGVSQLIAEGTPGNRVVFTSLADTRFGAGGTFDTNGAQPDSAAAGDWGGIIVNAGASASIDNATISYGGGETPIEGFFDFFNVIEVHQGTFRLANSRVEQNANGLASSDRSGRGTNDEATIFVRGSQPVIVNNDFRSNAGAVISVNANALSEAVRPDVGRSTGAIARYTQYDTNVGPLVAGNRISYSAGTVPGGAAAIAGMVVRGEEITVESIWDDTDIVHVLESEIIVGNFHTATGLRLQSRPDASLVVKLLGASAGFTASGTPLDISDRIGGTVQIVGQPGYPVVLSSLRDDTVGAGVNAIGEVVKDTNVDGSSTSSAPGDWRSLKFLPYANDRNVAVVLESEKAYTGGIGTNNGGLTAQSLGVLAPNNAINGNTTESAQEKSGDEYRRLGFEVHGTISPDTPTDVDIYRFTGTAGSEVWIDIDKTSSALDAVVELLNASGTTVLARSADSQLNGTLAGSALSLQKDSWRGVDFYSQNSKDAGFRVILPGAVGTQQTYLIRVRSQPKYEPVATGVDNGSVTATTPVAYANGLAAGGNGATSGTYELRVRLRQQDEKPGSTVRYADIRYPTIGIDAQGMPGRSNLVGETGENPIDDNNTFGTAQQIGNLLQTDQATISVAGAVSSYTDVDWYTFTLDYDLVQKYAKDFSWETMFDLDYGDGFRGDLTISVFNSSGKLIYIGRDSNVDDDQPSVGQGNDFDDLSRGSAGRLDPFIGQVHLPAGMVGSVTEQYYVAVSSNEWLPTAIQAHFSDTAANTAVRLEPIESVNRVVNGSLPNTTTPFTLGDVVLFVTNGTNLQRVNPLNGGVAATIVNNYGVGQDIGDLLMRSDGNMYSYAGLSPSPFFPNTAGRLESIDAGNGARTSIGLDNLPDRVANVDVTNAASTSIQTNATTIRWQFPNTLMVPGSILGTVALTRSVPPLGTVRFVFESDLAGNLTFTALDPAIGFQTPVSGTVNFATGTLTIVWSGPVAVADITMTNVNYSYDPNLPEAVTTNTVDALAWRRERIGVYEDLMYSVRDGSFSRLYLADHATGSAVAAAPFAWGFKGVIRDGVNPATDSIGIVGGMAWANDGLLYGVDNVGNFFSINDDTGLATVIATVPGASFQGLAVGPQNVNGGAYADLLFAIDATGALRAFDTTGALQNIFAGGANSIGTGVNNARGLAFSPLDINLWHGGAGSMYFGFEESINGVPGPQAGVVSPTWQDDLSSNPAIGDNYNLPGGAYGTFETVPFSLVGYVAADKPTLYFDYQLGSGAGDAAIVSISTDGGTTWGSLGAPLYQTATTRQARVDLGAFAGQADIRLQVTFTTGGLGSVPRGVDNDHFGFRIGNFIVGFAERGEEVFGATPGDTDFFDPYGPINNGGQILQGEYQLEIRRGTKYTAPLSIAPYYTIVQTFDTNTRHVESASSGLLFGDDNTARQQGQFIVESNLISDASQYGISITAGARDEGSNVPHPGVVRNLPVLNSGRLVPGAAVINNVVASSGTAAILISGDPNTGNVPLGAVPFARLVNNTIYGGATQNGIGVQVTQNAGPTMINNLFANLTTGVSVDGTSRFDNAGRQRTVVGASAYWNTATEVSGASQNLRIPLTSDPFVNAAARNFYLVSGSQAIDSSLDSLQDREEFRVVNASVGINGNTLTTPDGASPITSPTFDLYGQLRADDPTQATFPGFGTNVFKDIGAIDRVDRFQPTATLVEPLDGGPADLSTTADVVVLQREPARGLTRFEIQLSDNGIGIDKSTVVSAAFELRRNGVTLVEGTDYVFRYLESSNRVVFESASVFSLGNYLIIATSRASSSGVTGQLTDLANNRILGNQSNGEKRFFIQLQDVPGVPTSVTGSPLENAVALQWLAPASNGSAPITDYVIQYTTNGGVTWTTFPHAASAATSITVTGLVNGTGYQFRVAAVNAVGQGEFSALSPVITPAALPPAAPTNVLGVRGDALVNLTWVAPTYTGTAPLLDYWIQYSSNGGATWTTFVDGIGTGTARTVTGLTNGTAYLFRVAAVNKNGPSPWAATSVPVTPLQRASAPTITSLTAGINLVNVSWTTPNGNGSTITGYIVEYNNGTTTAQLNLGVMNTRQITGLVNGANYTVRVAAVTAAGTGIFSAWAGPVSPAGPAAAPTGVTLLARSTAVDVSWTAPTDNGGRPITDYIVRFRLASSAVWSSVNVGSAATSRTISGLVNGSSYVFQVAAITSWGTGAFSAIAGPVTPQPLAGPPTRLSGTTVSPGVVSLVWTAPATTGGLTITDYIVQFSSNNGVSWTTATDGVSTLARATVSVPAGGSYIFRVAAIANGVVGQWSINSLPVSA